MQMKLIPEYLIQFLRHFNLTVFFFPLLLGFVSNPLSQTFMEYDPVMGGGPPFRRLFLDAMVIEEHPATRGLTAQLVAQLAVAEVKVDEDEDGDGVEDDDDDRAWRSVDLRGERRVSPERKKLVPGLLEVVTVRRGTAYLVRTGPADAELSGAWAQFVLRVLRNLGVPVVVEEESADA